MSNNKSRRKKQVAQNLRQKEVQMDENQGEQPFDPNEHVAADVKAELEAADEAERLRIAAAEQQGKNRKSVLAAAGLEEGTRLDASGRVLHPWESLPKGAGSSDES